MELREVDIRAACRQHMQDIGLSPDDRSVTFQNLQARERTQLLMDLANKEGALQVGTGDLSELALGWTTFAGDHISMYNVNTGVPKTLVRELVRWVAGHETTGPEAKVLRSVLDTPVSPELLPPDEGGAISQRTEELVGPYELHDFFLFCLLRLGAGPSKTLFLAEHAFRGYYEPVAVQALDEPGRPQGRVGQPVAARRLAHAERRLGRRLARRARRDHARIQADEGAAVLAPRRRAQGLSPPSHTLRFDVVRT